MSPIHIHDCVLGAAWTDLEYETRQDGVVDSDDHTVMAHA